MTDADKRMNPIHFGSDSSDIRIWINPEMWIWILDQILASVEFVLSECSCLFIYLSLALLRAHIISISFDYR